MKAEMRKEGGSFVQGSDAPPKGHNGSQPTGRDQGRSREQRGGARGRGAVEEDLKVSRMRAEGALGRGVSEQRSCKRPRRRSGPATCILFGFLFLDETGDLGGCPGLSGRESMIDGTA